MPPFIVFSLPRSRSYWLSRFLNYDPWRCHHDIVTDLHSIQKLQNFFDIPYIGTCETGMVDGWRIAEKLVPDARRVVVKRPVDEVSKSLAKFDIHWDDELKRRDNLLDEVSLRPGVLTVKFDDLDSFSTCRRVFEHCLNIPLDWLHWRQFKEKNLQIDMPSRLRKLEKNRAGIEALKAEGLRMAA